MNIKPMLWILSVLLCGMAWPASALSILANGLAGPSGCADGIWAATSIVGAPSARRDHTAVWTGSEMLIWGGVDSGPKPVRVNTGGRYDPATDTWTATSTVGVPSARWAHAAVWTSSEMLVWGGVSRDGLLNSGGRYDPATDTWAAISTEGAPSARWAHTAVWTGAEMLIWGGYAPNTGGRYCASAGSDGHPPK